MTRRDKKALKQGFKALYLANILGNEANRK